MTELVKSILEVKNLSVSFDSRTHGRLFSAKTTIKALTDISFRLNAGLALGIVGESGSGKTTLAKALVGLNKLTSGSIETASEIDLKQDVQFVFQDPVASLNPRMTVEQLIIEPLLYKRVFTQDEKQTRLQRVMQQVGLDYAQRHRYPHEFSGGQCQRIGIARAMITEPKILICDEPVSALDVSIRAQIINLLKTLQTDHGLTLIFIAHDLSLVRFTSDQILVLYQGQLVEKGTTKAVFARPAHPYTRALITAEPRPDPEYERQRVVVDQAKDKNTVNSTSELACAYAARCPKATEKCLQNRPSMKTLSTTQAVACFY